MPAQRNNPGPPVPNQPRVAVSVRDIEDARRRLTPPILRTPLIRLDVDDGPGDIYLKPENLQPTGSFKVRGAGNAVALLSAAERKRGVYTCSAGNMASALAWHAHRAGIPCTVIVPDTAPETKIANVKRFGADIVRLSFDEVWKVALARSYPPLEPRVFVHPFGDPEMIAGNGTIGLEIAEDLPEVDTVLVPVGGGGLIAGIATGIKARRPKARIYGVEPETAAPLAASFAAGSPQEVKRIPTFVDGSGASSVVPEIWDLVRPIVSGSIPVSLEQVAESIRILFNRHRMIAEGAGASSVAAALSGRAGKGRIVCVVSGGNIDRLKLQTILDGKLP